MSALLLSEEDLDNPNIREDEDESVLPSRQHNADGNDTSIGEICEY